MKLLRLFLYFIIGLLLGGYSVLSHAGISLDAGGPDSSCPYGHYYVSAWQDISTQPCAVKLPDVSTTPASVNNINTNTPKQNPDGTALSPAVNLKDHIPVADPSTTYTPSGWTSGSSANGYQPIPPSTATPSTTGWLTALTSATVYTDAPTACVAAWAAHGGDSTSGSGSTYVSWTNGGPNAANTKCTSVCSGTGCGGTCSNAAANCGYGASLTSQLACPAGYSSSSGTCALVNAASVQKPLDGHCNVLRSGNSFYGDPNDPDCQVSGSPNVNGDTVTAKNGPNQQTVKQGADGSKTVTYSYYDQPTNTTYNTSVVIGSDGLTKGVQSQAAQGNIVSGGNQQGATVNIDTSNLATHADVSAVGSKLDTANTKLDAIKAGQCGGTGQPKCALDETGTPTTSTTPGQTDANTGLDGLPAGVKNLAPDYVAPTAAPFDNPLAGLPSGTCAPIVTSGWGAVPSISLDPCPVVNVMRPLIDWFMWVMAALFLWFRFNSIQSGVPE